jgi:hypothetical protein
VLKLTILVIKHGKKILLFRERERELKELILLLSSMLITQKYVTFFVFSPARGRGSTASSINVQQSNSRLGEARHSACIYCQQMGHSSSDCPSQVSGSRSARHRRMNSQSGMPAELPVFFFHDSKYS